MFDTSSAVWPGKELNHKVQAEHRAQQLYDQACQQNVLSLVWSALSGRSRALLELTTVQANQTIHGHHYAGTQTVPISQIRGSGSCGRCHDFDADFRPLKRHSRSRWLSVATAWQLGATLPPVELIQIGQTYFVEDGHHRISVAKALGYQEIKAKVTVVTMAHLTNDDGSMTNVSYLTERLGN